MALFGKKKAAKMELEGKELLVNPPGNIRLERLKARQHRLRLAQKKHAAGSDTYEKYERLLKRKEMEIKLAEGDY